MVKSSRKTKKTWVKNIDLNELEQNLELKRDHERLIGNKSDFIIDDEGDDKIGNDLTNKGKKLKSTEILTNKSKVPALTIERNRKPKGKVVKRLMEISGRSSSSPSTKLTEENLSEIKPQGDLWDIPTDTQPAISQPDKGKKTNPVAKPNVLPPKTLNFKPIDLNLENKVKELHPGKSYNPSLSSWKELINLEFDSEKIKELNRQQLVERQEMLTNMLNDEVSDDDDDNDSLEQESENDEANDEDKYKLSVNQPTKWKKKTKTQRNKQKRNEHRELLQNKIKELKSQIHQLDKLPEFTQEIEAASKPKVDSKKISKPNKLFKYNIMDKPIEVKLSNELNSNLKNLKSEGNLYYSNMINLQSKGLIETRIPVAKKSKYKKKITEKWSYKDFK